MYRILAVTGSLVTATAAMADWTPVPGRVLKDLVAGSTVVIDAPMGFKLPIRHAEDGTLSGEAGGLSFYLGSATDTGRWWVAGDRLCYQWSRWFKSEPRCMAIRRDGLRIHWEKDDGDTGTGTVIARKPAPQETIAASVRPAEQLHVPPAARPAGPASAATPQPRVATAASPTPPSPATAGSGLPRRAPAAPAEARSPQPLPRSVQTAAAAPVPRLAASTTPPPPYRVGAPEPHYRVVMVADDDVLNVRQGPSADHAAIAALEPDASGVRILGPCRSDWCFVRHGDIVGWVNRNYLAAATMLPRSPAQR